LSFLCAFERPVDHLAFGPQSPANALARELPLLKKASLACIVRSLQEEPVLAEIDCLLEESQNLDLSAAALNGWESLEDLIADSMPRLFRVADCVLHNHHDSEDALQDGLLLALRHLKQFRGNSRLSTWMHSIVRNSALAKLRQRRAHPMVSIDDQPPDEGAELMTVESPADPGPDPERACGQAELSYLFARILDDLPPKYRATITLCDFEGFSGKEAAERLGMTAAALKAQHHRARRAIRQSTGAQLVSKSGGRRARAAGAWPANQSNKL
jgi:RNA polymerase sigma-70 factor, ECF subfamily